MNCATCFFSGSSGREVLPHAGEGAQQTGETANVTCVLGQLFGNKQ